ncbi:MAG: FtsH protease activity modulator HflK [Sphingomonadaceae bacterium]|uniref:FtsH protease activity modulator HflK n=1 Tax=Thermaurantiacus sp. TaxID=2820283 RepID=UPI00298F232E|nr:FtsH protease activity modulator HflK [Thermaurantiacus sp.]MCS6986637.1 FtsH protease activity modulator HflK [Sphingomonadaceae bacterium]MDW8414101.1 FtsH protease activity modulator HflK [Thermaurantiacus sp.]
MSWHGNEESEPHDEGGRRRNPWETGGRRGARNPWGVQGDGARRDGEGRPTSTPDFDEFIRRSQERLREMAGGRPGTRPGGGGGRPTLPSLPWPAIVGGLVLAVLASTSAFRVDASERGVVTRFGKFQRTVGPGFHLKLPAPFEQVTKVRFDTIRSTDIGAPSGSSENLMITGDQNIIDIAYTVRWRVKNAEQFLFQLADQEGTVREVTEAAMREAISRATLDDAIGPERASIAQVVAQRTQEILDSYRSGIQVQGVEIKQADPPAAVDEAFKDVSAAQQDAQQFLNQARAYAQQVQAQAQGATAAFDKVYEQYRLAPEVTRKRMYLETMEQVLSKVDKTIVDVPGVTTYLPLSELQRRPAPAREARP